MFGAAGAQMRAHLMSVCCSTLESKYDGIGERIHLTTAKLSSLTTVNMLRFTINGYKLKVARKPFPQYFLITNNL